jgi:deoxyribose-phosphate aldolase
MKRATGSPGGRVFKPAEIIVASAVRPGAKLSDIHEVCSEALKHGIRSICIPSVYVGEAAVFMGNTGLKLSTMISFPTGLMPVDLKMMETRLASEHGVKEVYFYPNLGNYLDSRIVEFEWELSRVMEESQLIGLKNVKPVVEADLVSGKQLMEIAGIFETSGFDTLVFSSGFGLKTMGPGELGVLNTIGETMMVEAHCKLGSLQDLRSLVENRVCKVLTVDYGIVSEERFGGQLEE